MTDQTDFAGCAPLVSAEWLAAHLRDARLRLIDIRSVVDGGARQAYEQAHIPGSVHTDYVKDGWRATKGMATGMLPSAGALGELFARLGLSPDQHVVIVSAGTSAGDFSAAARVYWTLKMACHARLSILDGGMAAWIVDPARPIEQGAGTMPSPTNYPVSFDPAFRAELADVERAVTARSDTLLDSRAIAYFQGRDKSPQALRAGRLPGATQLEHNRAFDLDKLRLKTPAELRALFAGLTDAAAIHYCNTGQQAATTWFVLSEILKRPRNRLYDGSMSEWTEDGARPVETG